MSLAKVDSIKGKTIYLSGIDILTNTQIIDIKPYHYKDAVDEDYLYKITSLQPKEIYSKVLFTSNSALEL